MPSPFDIEQIHHHWQSLDWISPRPLTGEERRYAAYYHIDFDQQLDDLRHSFGYFDVESFRIACHLWQPIKRSRGTVLVSHGYFDHVGLYTHQILFLLKRGFTVVAFDLPGHGLSSGEQASIANFSQYQAVLTCCLRKMQGLPEPWHWLAQSTGGAIAMDFLLHTSEEQRPFNKIWLLAPLVWPFGWRSGKYLHTLLRPFARSLKRRFATNSHDQEFLDFLKHDDPLQSRRLSVTWITAWRKWLPTFLTAPPCNTPITILR
jgi:lysophospholipase